ncbi:MAG: hypoxanthine phosphoribosyltransferase [Candidatus Eisenbacteria bacterium]|uniref:Hypoxanthine phosphoribosyltransferase n=1 Tax=Eiseniibacteriota bacterium TaxID=2212470 RepID=A0A937X869_UNCEI|nr:hypoxanthine phosphoribosyltransferase [Candidatus Eisenbacteria bacterium]
MRVLLDREQIERRTRELAREISRDFLGKNPVLIGILKGSTMFLADLMRRLDLDPEIDFISISSYASGVTSSGTVRLLKDLDGDISGRDVLVVEDIIDSGLSLSYLRKNLLSRNPRSLSIVTLLDKRVPRERQVFVDYVGFEIEDLFVIGYGLDHAEHFRELPYVAVLEPDDPSGPYGGPI